MPELRCAQGPQERCTRAPLVCGWIVRTKPNASTSASRRDCARPTIRQRLRLSPDVPQLWHRALSISPFPVCGLDSRNRRTHAHRTHSHAHTCTRRRTWRVVDIWCLCDRLLESDAILRRCHTQAKKCSHLALTLCSAIYSAGADKTVSIWDVERGERVRKFQAHSSFVNSCCPSRRGTPLLVSGNPALCSNNANAVIDAARLGPICIGSAAVHCRCSLRV